MQKIILVQNYAEIIINPPKSHGKGTGLLHVMSISEILVHFGKENNIKLDRLIAFIKLGNKLILKGKVIL
jgi:hypothetical protein